MWYYDEHCLRRQNICTCKFHAFIASTDSRPITLIARISTWKKICTDILDQAMHHNQEPESVCQSRRKASLIFHSNMRRMLAICCMHGRLLLPRVRTQWLPAIILEISVRTFQVYILSWIYWIATIARSMHWRNRNVCESRYHVAKSWWTNLTIDRTTMTWSHNYFIGVSFHWHHDLTEIMTWISNGILWFMRDVISHPCPNILLKLWHGWVITYQCFKWK